MLRTVQVLELALPIWDTAGDCSALEPQSSVLSFQFRVSRVIKTSCVNDKSLAVATSSLQSFE